MIIRQTLGNYVSPRISLTAQSASRRLFPLRLRRQPVAIIPFHPIILHIGLPGPIHHCLSRTRIICRRPSLLLAPRIAPLHRVIPCHILCWMIARLPRSPIIKTITVGDGPVVNVIPQRLRHIILVHVKCRDINRVQGKLPASTIPQCVPHREAPGGNERHAGGGLKATSRLVLTA